MADDRWRMGFHITPRSGMIAPPLSITQDKGQYHLFYQWIAAQSSADDHHQLHLSSPNLIYWHFEDENIEGKTQPPAPTSLTQSAAHLIHPDKQAAALSFAKGPALAEMREADHGFDFSEPFGSTDEKGRFIALALMNDLNAPYSTAPSGLDWTNCLTVPRELTRNDKGKLLQYPVTELEALRMHTNRIDPLTGSLFPAHRADIIFSNIESTSDVEIDLDEGCKVIFTNGTLSLQFTDMRIGAGRNACEATIGMLHDLRLLIDCSSIEIFANKGEAVLSSRWFPRSESFLARCHVNCEKSAAWTMDDVLYLTYE